MFCEEHSNRAVKIRNRLSICASKMYDSETSRIRKMRIKIKIRIVTEFPVFHIHRESHLTMTFAPKLLSFLLLFCFLHFSNETAFFTATVNVNVYSAAEKCHNMVKNILQLNLCHELSDTVPDCLQQETNYRTCFLSTE